jgi:dihydrofolate reductase
LPKEKQSTKNLAMRKLKLQVQMTLDGFVAGPNGELNWMWAGGKEDESFLQKIIELADSCDTIVLGRKMTADFVKYWENVVDTQAKTAKQPLAQLMVNLRKIVFSRTQTAMAGRNLEVENGDLATKISELKKQHGKDIIVYGGANFVSSLIDQNLIDEYYIFNHPVAIGKGLSIFNGENRLELKDSITYKNGRILNQYLPV